MQRWALMGIVIGLFCAGLSAGRNDAHAQQQACDAWVSKIVSLQGRVFAKRQSDTQWRPARLYDTYCPGDQLRVEKFSRVAIVLSNESVLRLDQNTTLLFTGVENKKTFLLELIEGVAHFFSRRPRSLKIATPFVNGVVEGTEFYVKVDQNQAFLSLFEGRIRLDNPQGSLLLAPGQAAMALAGQPPRLEVVVRPRDAVQWALYYPPILALTPDTFASLSPADWQARVNQSMLYFLQGNLSAAFASLDDLGDTVNDHRFFIYRAGLRLAVGRVQEAEADIEQALALDAENSQALALRAVIAVVQNRKTDAIHHAQKAVQKNPRSAAARIALSYAQQANFNLAAALEEVQIAVDAEPENAIAWARLAELRLSAGQLNAALAAAQRASALSPNITRTQTVLGFAYLTQIKTDKARQAFTQAIVLDSADPLPRLGLGLAKIRDGHLEQGRADIEIAAGLDPNNALIRSYLGKAYFDEKRGPLDERQFEIAKTLDPSDPTPWFYDAIRKQTTNRPVAALQDLQKSIELNHNRAIYRSKLLLDQDLAVRSASLGRIYNELGFQELGLRQGWHSLNNDPSNYSAHRLLADSYAGLPRHEIARVSELLQSQLLQPLNLTPVQPQLAQTQTFILEGSGPASPSSNEFNPLFMRNRLTLQASGLIGSNATWGDEITQSGVWDQFSYSIGQFHYETDGFRDNNDQQQNIYNAFAQVSISPQSSFQAEYRHSNQKRGDLLLRFDPDNFVPSQREQIDTDQFRVGFYHNLAPGSDVITSFIYQTSEDNLTRKLTGLPDSEVRFDVESDSYLGEIQHILRARRFSMTTGIGYFDEGGEEFRLIDFGLPGFPNPPPEKIELNNEHTNLYTYFGMTLSEQLKLILGLSADFYHSDRTRDRDQLNPKLGVIWQIAPNTVIRGTVFRTLKRSLNSNQTVEPTQVAGFNQFFDDYDATDAWRYGIALDQKFSSTVYGGAELSKRDLDVPFVEPTSNQIDNVRWNEKLGRAYLYWTPLNWLAARAVYQYERFDRDATFTGSEDIINVETHRFPLGLGLYFQNGFMGQLAATYVQQHGEFLDASRLPVSGDDQFWIVDAELGYRFPRRLGTLKVGVKNLFDEEFNFIDTDPGMPLIQPERFFFGKITIAF